MTNAKVVFIHGMWNTPDVWFNFRPYFEKAGFDTTALALRHHDVEPGSEPHPDLGTTSLTDYADDLVAAIEKLETPPILVGHSLGGLLAQIVATRTKAKSVVALTPAPPAGVMAIKPSVFKIFRRILFTWGHWRKPTFPTFDEVRWGVFNNTDEDEARRLYAGDVWDSGRATAEIAHWLFDKKKASKVDTAKIDCPVLIFGAGLDRITPKSVCKAAADRYPDGAVEYIELPNHAHWVLGEHGWEKIADQCIEWIKAN